MTAVVFVGGASLVNFGALMVLGFVSFRLFCRGLPLPWVLRETGALTILAPDWWSRGARTFGSLVAISNARRQTYPAGRANSAVEDESEE